MSRFHPVAKLEQIPPGSARVVVVERREIALFNVGGTIHAIDAYCPHQGGPLGDGSFDGRIVSCPWHGWCFDVVTGKMTLGDFAAVDTFDVQLEGSTICVSPEPRE